MPASTPPTRSSRRPSSASSQGGQRLAALLFTLAEVHGLGLEAAQGLTLTEGFYWDRDDESRDFAKRFMERTGRMPNMIQAGTYSAVTQYLKAIDKAGTDETEAVAKNCTRCRSRTSSPSGGKVGANGRMIYDMYLFEVKKPAESTKPWDYYKVLATIPGDEAYIEPAESGCPLVKLDRATRPSHRTRLIFRSACTTQARRGAVSLRPRPAPRLRAASSAVNNVDLDVRHGEVHALIGPNGAGKTTVFNLLTKFLQPTAGTITLRRPRHHAGRRPPRSRGMGLVRSFQISAIFPHLTVLDNVRVALQRPNGLADPVLALAVGPRPARRRARWS